MRKIAIIELAGHAEVARAYMQMALFCNDAVTIVTNRVNQALLLPIFRQHNAIEWIIIEEHCVKNMVRLKEQLQHNDLILYCTSECIHGEVLHGLFPSKSYLVVHDLNNYFNPYRHINYNGGWKQPLRIIKYLISGYFTKRKNALSSFKGIIVPGTNMEKEFKRFKGSTSCKVVPFLYAENFEQLGRNHEQEYRIIIPGSFNKRSRNYQHVFEILKAMAERKRDLSITLILLGKCQIKEQAWLMTSQKTLAAYGVNLIWYNESIEQEMYDREIALADFFWLPLQEQWTYGIVNEVGGITCLSGNIGDLVRYGMPCLLPTAYPIEEILNGMVCRYDRDLTMAAEQILSFIEKKKFNTIKEEKGKILSKFNTWVIGQYNSLFDQ